MKKMNFLKIAFTLVLAFVITGAFAQTGTDLEGDGANLATSYDFSAEGTTGTTHMIEGTTVPLFAMPDSYFHPSYQVGIAVPVYTIDAGFVWNWSVTGAVGVGTNVADITFSQNGVNDNYVEISGGVADGVYTINVQEEASAAMGSCSDAGENIEVNVYATPSVTLAGAGLGDTEDCEGSIVVANAVVATISGGWQNYRTVWTLSIHTLNNLGAIDFYYDDEAAAGTNPEIGAKNILAADFSEASPDASLVAGANDITTVAAFNAIDGKTTVYTYTLESINDQALRFADFIGFTGDYAAPVPGDFSYSAFAETVTITVNPAPNTGPIYHINSSWAN